jgi:hypothetical protein
VSTVAEVAVLVVMVTAAVGLLVGRSQTQRLAAMVLAFATLTARAWKRHDSPLWITALAVVTLAAVVALIRTRRTTTGK